MSILPLHRVLPGRVLFLVLLAWGWEMRAGDWPELRGPHGNGHCDDQEVPLHWSDTAGIAWKSAVPGLGWSTPVTHNGTIWITSARDDGASLHVVALHGKDGSLAHDIPVFVNNEPKAIHDKNSHASPSAVVRDDRVYVHFGTYGTACIDAVHGTVLWRQKLDYEPRHGPGGSPVLHDDLLVVNCDGTDVQYLVALDAETGEVRWKTNRAHVDPLRMTGGKNMPMAFSTPTIWHHGDRTQVISAGADHVAGYDLKTGQELWWSAYDGYSIVLRPTIDRGIVYFSSCYDNPIFYAVRLGGDGDVTQSNRVWSLERGAPHCPSPLVIGDEIYFISDNGIASCLDAASGKQHWQERLGGNFSASPIYAAGRIYALSEKGVTTVFAPGKEYVELAKNEIQGRTLASLSTLDGDLLMRTDTHLLRLSERE
jgi:outer membrane protein assembly factor BamB